MHAGGQWQQGRLIERLWDKGNPLSRVQVNRDQGAGQCVRHYLSGSHKVEALMARHSVS
jgi:hypothetical protein